MLSFKGKLSKKKRVINKAHKILEEPLFLSNFAKIYEAWTPRFVNGQNRVWFSWPG